MMVVVATTETCRDMDWLCENFGIIKCMVHMAGNLQTNNFKIIFPASCLLSCGAAVHFVVFLHRQVPTFASDGGFKQEPSHGRSQLKPVFDDVMSARLFNSRVSKKRFFVFIFSTWMSSLYVLSFLLRSFYTAAPCNSSSSTNHRSRLCSCRRCLATRPTFSVLTVIRVLAYIYWTLQVGGIIFGLYLGGTAFKCACRLRVRIEGSSWVSLVSPDISKYLTSHQAECGFSTIRVSVFIVPFTTAWLDLILERLAA